MQLLLSSLVVFDSLQPHGLYPARLLCPWDFPAKNTGVGSLSLLQGLEIEALSPALEGGFFTTEPPGKPFLSLRSSQTP